MNIYHIASILNLYSSHRANLSYRPEVVQQSLNYSTNYNLVSPPSKRCRRGRPKSTIPLDLQIESQTAEQLAAGRVSRHSQLGRSGGSEEASAAWRRWRRCFHWRPRDWPLGYLSAVCTFLNAIVGASSISVLCISDSIILLPLGFHD
jgi:hypothetical protein